MKDFYFETAKIIQQAQLAGLQQDGLLPANWRKHSAARRANSEPTEQSRDEIDAEHLADFDATEAAAINGER